MLYNIERECHGDMSFSQSLTPRKHNTMCAIINLTQHNATSEQVAVGVVEPSPEDKKIIQELLTFEEFPYVEELERRAYTLATLVTNMGSYRPSRHTVMIGGAPFFMGRLEAALKAQGHHPVYAFSRRRSYDQTKPDGTVKKVAIFQHLGFVEV